MKTFKIFFATLLCLILASNVQACNQGAQPTNANSVEDSNKVTNLQLISPSPNPSNGATTVGFTNSQTITYSFYIVGVHGDTVLTLATNQIATSGNHSFIIPSGTLLPGLYFYEIQSGSTVLRKRFVITE